MYPAPALPLVAFSIQPRLVSVRLLFWHMCLVLASIARRLILNAKKIIWKYNNTLENGTLLYSGVIKCHPFFQLHTKKPDSEKERCMFSTACLGCDHLTAAVAAAHTNAPLPYLIALPWIHQWTGNSCLTQISGPGPHWITSQSECRCQIWIHLDYLNLYWFSYLLSLHKCDHPSSCTGCGLKIQ